MPHLGFPMLKRNLAQEHARSAFNYGPPADYTVITSRHVEGGNMGSAHRVIRLLATTVDGYINEAAKARSEEPHTAAHEYPDQLPSLGLVVDPATRIAP